MITIPTLSQLYLSVKNDLETEYGSAIPAFGKIFLRALAGVQAAKLKLCYLALGKLQKNIFIDTADPEASGGTLERFGRVKLGRNPFPAQAGQYRVTVTGTAGATIPAQTTFKANDDSTSPGKLFMLDTPFTLSGSSGVITLRALTAGTTAKLLAGDELTVTAPIANVNSIGTVQSESVQPIDSEDIEEYRTKAIEAFQLEPNGGAPSDFRIWAADAAGVSKVYPFAKPAASAEVNLYVEATPADSVDGYGTPSAAMLTAVEAVVEMDPDVTKPLNERGRRPLGIWRVHYLPITLKTVDIEIPDYEGLTAELQTEIFNALKELTDGIRPFVAGADTLESKNDILDVNRIVSTILSVRPGAVFGTVILKINTVPLSTFTFYNGDIPRLNSVTYP